MGAIEQTVAVYERLKGRKYKVTVENGIEFVLDFDKKYYHHLAGYHYLTDVAGIAAPVYGKARFYQRLKNGWIKETEILCSQLFHNIAERIEYFGMIEEILSAGACKIIVEFDRRKADSDIEAKFYLYQRRGNSLLREPVTYYMLFIGCDTERNRYYPATYIVEHSTKYTAGQTMLNCKIEWME